MSWVRTAAYAVAAALLTGATFLFYFAAAVPVGERMFEFPGQTQALVTAESATYVVKGERYTIVPDVVTTAEEPVAAYAFYNLDNPSHATLASPHSPWAVAAMSLTVAFILMTLAAWRLVFWRVLATVFPNRLQAGEE